MATTLKSLARASPANPSASRANVMTVLLESSRRGRRQGYNVLDAATGELLIVGSRDPENDACRILFNRGHVGVLETRWRGSASPAMRVDIASAARRSVLETRTIGPVAVTWRPFNQEGRLPPSGLIAGGDFDSGRSVGALP